MNIITPPSLKKGDSVGIVATARKINVEEFSHGIAIFKSWGLNVVFAENMAKEFHQYAGTDEERIDGIQKYIGDDNIKAIVCVRGGYGTLRIIDKIDFSLLEKKPKWICGYSDITVIHHHLLAKHSISSLHSTMPVNMKTNSAEAIESFRKVLFGENISYKINTHPLNRFGNSEGILCGGNLSLIYALNGSTSLPDMNGKILFLEDLDEYLYHIDRMMLNLKRSGILKKIKGLVVGGFTGMKDNAVPFGKTIEEIILEHVGEYDYPVCFGFPAGHIDDNRALIMGNKIKFEVSNTQTHLQFL